MVEICRRTREFKKGKKNPLFEEQTEAKEKGKKAPGGGFPRLRDHKFLVQGGRGADDYAAKRRRERGSVYRPPKHKRRVHKQSIGGDFTRGNVGPVGGKKREAVGEKGPL